MRSNILIVGGSGFVGTNILRKLIMPNTKYTQQETKVKKYIKVIK